MGSLFLKRDYSQEEKTSPMKLFIEKPCELGEIKCIFTLSPKERKEIMMNIGSKNAKMMSTYSFVLSILMVLLLSACVSQTSTPAPSPATATPVPPTAVATPSVAPTPIGPDYWPTEGWRTSTPEEQGLDSEQLAELMDYLQEQDNFTIHSLLIIRNGHVVTDAYFQPFAQDSLHELASATKSFTSSLIGIAIDKGYIEGVEQPVLDFFPERTVANLDANKQAMTLENLLTMRSGSNCSDGSTFFTLSQMKASPDWVQFALDLPVNTKPGTHYNYCNLNSHLLSAIIQETTGMSALAFAQEQLFGPLGVSDVIWPPGPQGNNRGWGEMKLAPHDMAKLGYLFLNEGLWDGQQVLSTAWVRAASSGSSYGYQWWLKPSGTYFASGVGGQEIWVLPDRDMVVVMTGETSGGGAGEWGDQLMGSHIVPLAISGAPLPPNPDGVATLESKIQAAVAPVHVQPEPIAPFPEIAQRVAGISYVFDDNPWGLLSFTLSFPTHDEALLKVTTLGSGAEADPQFEWLMGLDNVDRIAPGRFGLLTSAKGSWESETVFVAHIDDFANEGHHKFRISLAFEGDQLTVEQWVDGTLAGTLFGRVEE
jgi:CubicO group peptidase (beta-lactamase class C family)